MAYGSGANWEIALGTQHHTITTLVVTTLWEFAHNAFVELDNNKVLHMELDYFETYLHCGKYFSLKHEGTHTIHLLHSHI